MMMISNSFLWICVIFYCASVQSEVIQLTSNNISEYLQDHVTFIRFYSNWCPHSKKFESTWKRFAEMKQNSDLHVAEYSILKIYTTSVDQLLSRLSIDTLRISVQYGGRLRKCMKRHQNIDCSDDALLCSDHDVFGYPTMKLFVRGSGARYEGPRQLESLEAFYREKLAEDTNFEDSIATKTAVIELAADNFAQLTSKGFAFIAFFAPWCKHCKALLPVFQELAKQMINTDGLIFATVDCTTHKILCSKYAIHGYPTLIWFEDGHERDRYVKAREVNTMRNYIEEKIKDAQPTTTEAPPVQAEPEHVSDGPLKEANVLNAKTFTQGVSFEGYTFVNFGAPWCSHCQKLAPIWDQLAQKFSEVEEMRISRVDCTASESICRDYGIRAFPTLILFRYGESKVEYNGVRDFDSLYHFLVGQFEFFGDDHLLKAEGEMRNE